ncbi:MAG: glutathione S-transferase family protein [Proteobacteria bacterium]|nr:glutathione S-transferase family protein [Pseudomonadota bacterium]
MSLTLYAVARSRGLRNLWLIEELGIPCTVVQVTPAEAASHPRLGQINPNRQVPAIDDDGLALSESFAINLYLARKHGGPLAAKDAAEDARILMWTFWVVTAVEPEAIQVLYNRVGKPEPERVPARADQAMKALEQPLAMLEGELARSPYLVGNRFTVADLNVAAVLVWLKSAGEDMNCWPNIKRWLDAAWNRPAAARVWERRVKGI